MNINTLNTRTAFDKVSDKMEYLTKQVHTYVLESGFLETHHKSITKAIEDIASRHDELLVQTFIGKLRHKLPKLRMGIKMHEFNKERARIIAASLITQVLIDNDAYPTEKKVETTTVNGRKKFHTRVYMQLGGSYEKDLLKGIESKPGVVHQKEINGWKLKAVEKAFLRRVGSVPFCVSDVCTKELLLKGYSLKVDWGKSVDKNGKSLPEDPIVRKQRYNLYADTVIDQVQTMGAFYLPAKYCDRKRVYYEAATLEGVRPHGKLWETLMIDSAVEFDLTEADERVLKHIIYTTFHGRVSVEEANELFTMEDLLDANMIDPMAQDSEEAFGEAIMLNKAYQAIQDYKQGKPSKFLFGYDFTNSGLLMSGVSFRSEKMMKAGNIAGSNHVVDSHTAFGSAYDLPLDRKDIKKIHMGLMHGSAMQSIATAINETLVANGNDGDCFPEVTVDAVNAYNEAAYGAPVANIPAIAEWGTKVVGNEQNVLRWTMPDGFSCASRAYLKGVPVLVYSASASHKEGYTSHVVVSDMPWLEDKNGFPVYGKEVEMGGVVYEVQQKKRGLFANMTHGNDSYMLRHIGNTVLDSGRPILFKHDDFITPPSALETVELAAKEVFDEMFTVNFYQEAVDEIIKESPYDIPAFDLIVGDGPNTIWESENFLMP